MFGLISKKKLIKLFSEELATKQIKADYWYYIKNDQNMSSFILESVHEIRVLANKLGITKDMYESAYKIYDFRNSGKKHYAPDLQLLEQLNNL